MGQGLGKGLEGKGLGRGHGEGLGEGLGETGVRKGRWERAKARAVLHFV